jgi:hypothetical protein
MTERTPRMGTLPLTLMIAAVMTCLTGCGGCSSEPEVGPDEGSEQASASAQDDSGAASAAQSDDDAAQPLPDTRSVSKGARPAAKKGDEVAPIEATASPQPAGALNANAKRLENRKILEADLKKRANRRRDDGKQPIEQPSTPAGTAPSQPAAAPVDSALTRAVPRVGAPATAQVAKNTRAAPPKQKLLNIGRYMTITDARRITEDATLSKGKPLTGIEPGPNYNVSYFAPQLRSKFGVSVQVWKEKIRRDANDRYRKMKRDFPNAEDTTAISPSALFSHFQGIMSLSFVDLTKSIVVSVSCGDTVCSDDELVALANAVKKRL